MIDLRDDLPLDPALLATFERYARVAGFEAPRWFAEDACKAELEPLALWWREATNLLATAEAMTASNLTDRDRRVLLERAGEALRRLGALLD